jgi:very-short-patch-repair endonuclease
MQGDSYELFGRVIALAERQWGIVTFAQLTDLGASQSWISRKVRAGQLHRVHRGVFSVVPPSLLRPEGRWLAAVLSCGPGAALSHNHALALWDLRSVAAGARIHVTVPTYAGRPQRPGLRIHRSMTLAEEDVTERRGVPVTTVRRTLRDLRHRVAPHVIREIVRRAEQRQLEIGPLPDERIESPTRTELERRFAALTRRHGLPRPATQQVIGPYTVDFLWPGHGVIVEVDGWETHGTRTAFEDDRARDAWLTSKGYRVLRFTWRQVTEDGPAVAKRLRSTLG